MTSKKPILLVFGATGAQGGSVVEAVINHGNQWALRALVRDPNKDKAKELAKKGVELVKGDVNNVEDLRKAFKGVDATFFVTFFWDPSVMGKELESGKKAVDIAKESNVKEFVFSSLPNVSEISNNKWHVPHSTDKKLIGDYAKSIGLKVVEVSAAFYYQNFQGFFPPKVDDKGTYTFVLPMPEDKYITAFDVEDIGVAVVNVLKNFKEWEGKFIPLVGSHMHPQEYVKIFSEVTKKPAIYKTLTVEEYGKFPGATDIAQMFGYFNEFGGFGPKYDIWLGKKVNPKLKTWEEWLKKSKWGQ